MIDLFANPGSKIVSGTKECQCCATRGHVYMIGCPKCEARMLARAPASVLVDRPVLDEFKALIEAERERDAADGVVA